MHAAFVRVGLGGLAIVVVVCALVSDAIATTLNPVPEIDGSVIPAAMGLVTAGVLMLRARRRK